LGRLERNREGVQQIAVGTGLDVDIVAGSSPEPVTVALPAGRFGQPSLELTEGWLKKGVAVGVAGLTVLAAVTAAFHGVVVGSLLGDAVAVQVRGVDYVAVAATVTLGVLAVADVVFLMLAGK
jgi:hypothetical protein